MSPVSHDQEALGLIDRWTDGQARTLYLARKDTYLEEVGGFRRLHREMAGSMTDMV
jgi:hypothetical protein